MSVAAVVSPQALAVIDITGLTGVLLLLAPIAILVIVVARASRVRDDDEPSEPAHTMHRMLPDVDMASLAPSAGTAPAESPSDDAPSDEPRTAAPTVAEPATAERVVPDAAPAPPPEPVPAVAPVPAAAAPEPAAAVPPAPRDWAALIEAAEQAGDHAAVPAHYLAYARDEIGQGRNQAASDHLRTALKLAAKARNAPVQAEARLELADLARAVGDLTTACEHWQIARALFYEMKSEAKLGETEGLMQKHGCPTDWVLNDF